MRVTRHEIDAFFETYARALSARDGAAIVACWAVPALVLSDDGAIAADIADVHAVFAWSMEQYAGVVAARPTITSATILSEQVASCQVRWDHQDGAGVSLGGELAYYMLKRDGHALQIHVFTPISAG